MALFGLVGFPLGHTFSSPYINQKFARENLPHRYKLFELPNLAGLPALLKQHPALAGFNVTLPYKQQVLPYLHALDPVADKIGAVNTVKITHARLTGYNTDWLAFRESVKRFLPAGFAGEALILGTGGSAQAVKAALEHLQIPYASVSRQPGKANFTFANCTKKVVSRFQLIINTTPLGMYPTVADLPPLPYQALTPNHYLFDLVYNPAETEFLKKGTEQGCHTKGGLEMLHLQAEAAWQIWEGQGQFLATLAR